jgi:hypothetical protein
MGTHVWRETEFAQDASADAQPSLLMLLEQLDYQQGEKRLMLAVLKDAVECIERYNSSRGSRSLQAYRAALRWVFAQDQAWPFSFENICLALALDPVRFRFALCSPLPVSTGKVPTRLPASQRSAP